MKTIRFYVMEDVPEVRHEIIQMLQETAECEVIGSSDNLQEGFEDILELKPEALMLDIQLIGGTAFELLRRLKEHQFSLPPVVIMTGNPEFDAAQEAVDVAGPALVKLLDKPFWKSWPREFPLIKSVILARIAQMNHDDPDLLLKSNLTGEELYVRSSHMTYRLIVPRILYLDAEKGFTTIVSQGDKAVKVRKTLNELMSKLPAYICRISRDKAVNLRHLEQIDHETDELFLDGCKENFFIGEPYKAHLKSLLGI